MVDAEASWSDQEKVSKAEKIAMEKEISKGRAYHAVLGQIKYVLHSVPGTLTGITHNLGLQDMPQPHSPGGSDSVFETSFSQIRDTVIEVVQSSVFSANHLFPSAKMSYAALSSGLFRGANPRSSG